MFCCLNCLRSRRAFLAADASGSAPAAPAGAAAAMRWIDVHCHVFNALDLPMNQFIDQTRLSAEINLPLWVIVAILVGGLQGAAISAAAEAAALESGGASAPAPQARSLADAVQALAGPSGEPAGEMPEEAVAHLFAAAPLGGQALLRQAAADLGIHKAPDEPLTRQDHEAIAQRLDADPSLPRVIAWANGFSSNRNTLVASLLQQFGSADTVMLTPSFIDYNRWLGINRGDATERSMSSMADQLRVMQALARWRACNQQRPMPVFSFVPFDPWRFLEDEPRQEDVLTLARPYIEEGSVIGFKLYPPMGFAPTGNTDRDPQEFPQLLRALTSDHAGEQLDRALDKLFAYCAENDVPVMAHCGNTNFPVHGPNSDAHFAGPEYWQPVLDRYPILRLNLGHFGGVWDFAASGPAQNLARRWASYIAGFMEHHPNLYADVAFADTLLHNPGDPELAGTVQFLATLVAAHPILRQRLMYGSDWEMVGMAEFGGEYASHIIPNLRTIFADDAMEDFRWRNAARFLGLGPTDKPGQRLRRFLAANGVAQDLLAPFDPTPAVE